MVLGRVMIFVTIKSKGSQQFAMRFRHLVSRENQFVMQGKNKQKMTGISSTTDLGLLSDKQRLVSSREGEFDRYKFSLQCTQNEVFIENRRIVEEGKETWILYVVPQDATIWIRLLGSPTLEDLINSIKMEAEQGNRRWMWWNRLFYPHHPILNELSDHLGKQEKEFIT